ncbi:MAG TPA: CBS domain-containing protein [Bryobacteraceae bacterium]
MTEIIASILKTKGNAVWSVAPDSTVYDAISLMAERSVGALLVLSENQLVGIISERDYARKVILQGRSSKDTPVHEIMTRSPITVTPDHTVDECMVIMTQCRIRHLPILDRARVVGVLSIGDLVKAIIRAQAHTIDQLHTYISGSYPS